MDERTYLCLDLGEIEAQFDPHFVSAAGRRAFLQLPVHSDPERLEAARAPVRFALEQLERQNPPPFERLEDPEAVVQRLDPEGTVDGRALRSLAAYLDLMDRTRDWLLEAAGEDGPFPCHDWPSFGTEGREILRRVQPDGEPDPRQNPSLQRWVDRLAESRRRRLVEARRLYDQVGPEVWQDSAFADRSGRLLLPLKTDFRGRVAGIVHSASQSGQTLFVEPLELVGVNNDCIEAEEGYRRECRRILQDLARAVLGRRDELALFLGRAAAWETVLARARWGWERRAGFPAVRPSPQGWELLDARHPLLGERAVGVSLRVPPGTRGLVISGPNTGGKTVLLKTIAVLCWLNQRACPVPADPSGTLPLFREWIADLGDHQSVESDLSTFSAHLARHDQILRQAGEATLVLLDELGGGTDPREGGALAAALLEALEDRGVFVVVSTHHHLIKSLPRQREGYLGVGMEFDPERGRPTYRVLAGVSGSSHALEIARRVGLPDSVLRRAREILEESTLAVERRLARLDEEERALQERAAELQRREAQLGAERDRLLQELRRFTEERRTWEQGRARRLEEELAGMRRHFEALVRRLEESREAQVAREGREWLRENTRRAREDLAQASERGPAVPTTPWSPGDRVLYQGRVGVLEVERKPGLWRVRFDGLTMDLAADTLAPADEPSARGDRSASTAGFVSDKKAAFVLDLRGDRVEEALRRLEEQIDRALLEGLAEFHVIHGLGEGRLMRAVKEYLSTNPHVRGFHHPRPEEGGFGKTIVRLE